MFDNYVLLRLYTDQVPAYLYGGEDVPSLAERKAEAERNGDFQFDVYKEVQLPFYAIIQPTKKVRQTKEMN